MFNGMVRRIFDFFRDRIQSNQTESLGLPHRVNDSSLYKEKISEARNRFGKPFITELQSPRVTTPSRLLQELNEKAPRVNKITQLARKK